MKYIVRILIFFVLLIVIQLHGALAEDSIILKSGESLPGRIENLNHSYLRIYSYILAEPVDIKLTELDELTSSRPLNQPNQFSVIKLNNGDTFYGILKTLDSTHLQLQTTWNQSISVNKGYVYHIGFDSPKTYLSNATESLRGWKNTSGNMVPECRNGHWIWRGSNNTALETSFPMPPRLHIQLSLYHTNVFGFNISLWKDNDSEYNINLALSQEKIELTQQGQGQYKTLGRTRRQTSKNWYTDTHIKRSDIQFYADREKGNFYLYINGNLEAKWEGLKDLDKIFIDDSSSNEKYDFCPGNSLSLSGYDDRNMAVFNFNVFDWNGAVPQPLEETDIVSRYDLDSPKDKVLLINGDVLRGTISIKEDGSIRIKSSHYDVTVPTAKVKSLDQKSSKEEKQVENKADIRVYLTDQSIISLSLTNIQNRFLEGTSEALGNLKIPLNLIKRIQFNLNHPDLQKQRANPF